LRTIQKKIEIDIPAGVDDGTRLRVQSAGETLSEGRTGNLYVTVHVTPHKVFRKEGMHIVMDLDVKLTDAILGATYEIETLDGTEKLRIPPGIKPGTVLRLRNKGVQGGFLQKGDLLVVTYINIPEKLSKEEKELIEKLREKGL